MKGLILKDLKVLRQQASVYLAIILMWLVLSIVNHDASFLGGVMIIFSVMIIITTMAYDEKAKWDRYALTMPLSRKDVVASKYLLGLLNIILSVALFMVVSLVFPMETAETWLVALSFFSLGLIFLSVILPVMFKFGVEKGRLIMTAVVLAPVVLAFFLSKINVNMPDEALIEKLLYLSPVIAIIIMLVSVGISLSIYLHKEL
jgi:ABC-type transport system involved in multi-copper enzyme maturation permease subunit